MRRFCISLVLLAAIPFSMAARDWYAEAEEQYYASRYADAIRLALEGAGDSATTESELADLYSILGSCYARLGAFDKAAQYFVRCYEFDKENGGKEGLTSSLINLASMYVYAGEPSMAVNYALEAIANEEEVGRSDKLAMALGKACDVYHALGMDTTALSYADRAVKLAQDKLDSGAQAVRRSQRAYPLIALGRYREAFTDLSFAEEVFRRDGNRQSLSIVCFQLAQEYGRMGAGEANKQYLKEAHSLARELGDMPLLQKICTMLSDSYGRENPGVALGYFKEASALADSIARSKSDHALELYNIEYETARREETIQRQQEELSRERRMRLVISLAALLLLIASAVMAYMVVRLRRSERSLTRSNEQNSFLLKVISHDLYSPAAARLGSLRMLNKGVASLPPDQLGRVFTDLEQQAKSEVELLDNVLLWSRSRSGKTEDEAVRFDLSALAEEAVYQYAQSAAQKDITMEAECEPGIVVVSNRSSVMLALRNLLSNAVKFSRSGSKVRVSVARCGNEALVSVTDEGVGIPASKLGDLFLPGNGFRRQGTAGEVSNGIGLSVSRDMISTLGGTISVESTEGQGSTFTIHLPADTDNA